MAADSLNGTCKAYAIEDNVRLGGSRFIGHVTVTGRGGRVTLSGRRVSMRRMLGFRLLDVFSAVIGGLWEFDWRRPYAMEPMSPGEASPSTGARSTSLGVERSASWTTSGSRFEGVYTSCVDGSLLGRRTVVGPYRVDVLPAVPDVGTYVVAKVRAPIGLWGQTVLVQLEVPVERKQALLHALSGSEVTGRLL